MDKFAFLQLRPETSELSEESLEQLCVVLCQLRLKDGRPIRVYPNRAYFTEDCLRKFFGWTDEDFTR